MWKTPKYQFCQSSFVFNSLQNSKDKVLVLDTRDPELFSSRSISGSIHLSRSKIEGYLRTKESESDLSDLTLNTLTELMSIQEQNKFKQRKRVFCIVLMSESSLPLEFITDVRKLAQHDGVSDAFSVLKSEVEDSLHKLHLDMEEKNSVIVGKKIYDILHQDKVSELYILLEGASHFFTKYPFMEYSFEQHFPNDIWENKLFLGSYSQAAQESVVKTLDITHVINATIECPNVYEDHKELKIKYLKIHILDESQEHAHKHFKDTYEFIEDALSSNNNHKVLLHCAKGKSRSATLTIMFLMKKLNWSFQQAVDYVKLRRWVIDPNDGFVKQLEDFETRKCEFHWE